MRCKSSSKVLIQSARMARWGVAAACALATAAAAQTRIPARFDADRVYVQLQTRDGKPLELYSDTGGGGFVLSAAAAKRLGIAFKGELAERPDTANEAPTINAPELAKGLPPLPKTGIVVPRAAQLPVWPEQGDGVIGAPWFDGGIWTWDYPRGELTKEAPGWRPAKNAVPAELHFKTDPDGSRPTHFARIMVEIAGQPVPMLLDTGAETYLTEEAAKAIGSQTRERATSMLSDSIFRRLQAAHPAWRVVKQAQVATQSDMLEVPDVKIAGMQVGPVWFTHRSDKAFHDFMSSMMDARVEGAIGGNAFASLRMTIDYPKSRAYFCRSAACL